MTRVRFFLDGVARFSDDSDPYGSCMPTAGVSLGRHTLMARAYDADGGMATSTVAVYRGQGAVPAAGPKPPSLTLITPAGAATFGDYVCVAATATDDDRVTRVRFLLDGAVVLSDDTPPYGSCLPVGLAAPGTHSLSAYAYDADGGSASAVVTIVKG